MRSSQNKDWPYFNVGAINTAYVPGAASFHDFADLTDVLLIIEKGNYR